MSTNLEEAIRQRAYLAWESQGCPEGRDLENWLEAERAVMAEVAPAEAPPKKQVKKKSAAASAAKAAASKEPAAKRTRRKKKADA